MYKDSSKMKNPEGKKYDTAKRGFDVTASLIGMTAALPLAAAISLLIVIDDHTGNVIFRQTRVGMNGRPFVMYKFRTMRMAEGEDIDDLLIMNESDGPVFKMKDDPRITRFGSFLRRSHLDELPQLANILKGDMSFVGPRPPLPQEVECYEDRHRQRLSIKPGLTCYWQIRSDKYDMPFDEWVDLDLKYIRERCLTTDLKILAGTIKTVFRMEGR